MKIRAIIVVRAIAGAAALGATPALAGDEADAVRLAMREAMREQAPMPSRPPMLPDRTAAALPRTQVAATKTEAERYAHARALKDGTNHADVMRAEAANHAAMRPMMSGSAFGGSQYGCDNQLPADMMKSRGTMPGGGMMTPGSAGPGSGGMPGGMQLSSPQAAASTGR